MKEFARRQEVIREDRRTWQQVAFVGGHTDDDAMFRLTNTLAQQNIGVTILTLTNSDARNLPNYEPEQLAKERWEEAIISGDIAGITEVRRIEIPDGKLSQFPQQAREFVGNAIDEIEPIALVTLHLGDPHTDHRETYSVGSSIAGRRLAHYTTDTITGLDLNGRVLHPDLYIPLTEEVEAIEQQTYIANSSQVENLPPEEKVDVDNVIYMTARRGKERKLPYAAVLYRANNSSGTPLESILPLAS
ncbi:MAG: PIG-L deacetylase family protein [Candidatus Levyibacteriota bacterium]